MTWLHKQHGCSGAGKGEGSAGGAGGGGGGRMTVSLHHVLEAACDIIARTDQRRRATVEPERQAVLPKSAHRHAPMLPNAYSQGLYASYDKRGHLRPGSALHGPHRLLLPPRCAAALLECQPACAAHRVLWIGCLGGMMEGKVRSLERLCRRL